MKDKNKGLGEEIPGNCKRKEKKKNRKDKKESKKVQV